MLSLLLDYHIEKFLRESRPFKVSRLQCLLSQYGGGDGVVVVILYLKHVLGNEYLQVLFSPF